MSYPEATSRFEAVRYGVLLAPAVFRQFFALEKSGFAASTQAIDGGRYVLSSGDGSWFLPGLKIRASADTH